MRPAIGSVPAPAPVTGTNTAPATIIFGTDTNSLWALVIYLIAMAVIVVLWLAASPFTLRYPRVIQAVGRASIGWLKGLMEWFVPKGTYSESDISQYFWPNGKMPDRDAFAALAADDWASYRLRVGGLVAHPRDFTLADLRAMDKHEQITQHYCIQGWSGIAKWGGVSMRAICEAAGPTAEAVMRLKFTSGMILLSTSAMTFGRLPDCSDLSFLIVSSTSVDSRLIQASGASSAA